MPAEHSTGLEISGPGAHFEINDLRFRTILQPNAMLERIATGFRWAEGPAWFPQGEYLVWSDLPNNRILQWIDGAGHRVLRSPSAFSNGNTVDRQGRLVTCEHETRRVTRTGHDGRITVLAEHWRGKRLNSPNDVIVATDDSIWFTDPPYGLMGEYEGREGERELDGAWVWRLAPGAAEPEPMITDMVRPNGLAFSPNESKLYVADSSRSHDPSGNHHVRVFRLAEGKVSGGDVFATIAPGCPDGLRVDRQGNGWISAADGVHCFSPAGELLGKIRVPEPVTNLCFGGERRNRLFITATTSVYASYLAVSGI
jgi:gluconolactonase